MESIGTMHHIECVREIEKTLRQTEHNLRESELDVVTCQKRIAELEAHETQTHQILGSVLGTDTSLEDAARRMVRENETVRCALNESLQNALTNLGVAKRKLVDRDLDCAALLLERNEARDERDKLGLVNGTPAWLAVSEREYRTNVRAHEATERAMRAESQISAAVEERDEAWRELAVAKRFIHRFIIQDGEARPYSVRDLQLKHEQLEEDFADCDAELRATIAGQIKLRAEVSDAEAKTDSVTEQLMETTRNLSEAYDRIAELMMERGAWQKSRRG
jgi:hypothetical protein